MHLIINRAHLAPGLVIKVTREDTLEIDCTEFGDRYNETVRTLSEGADRQMREELQKRGVDSLLRAEVVKAYKKGSLSIDWILDLFNINPRGVAEPKAGDISDGSPADAEGFRRYVRLANVATVEDQVILFPRRTSPQASDSLREALGKPLDVINKALKKLISKKMVGVVRLGVEGHPGYVLTEKAPYLNKEELSLSLLADRCPPSMKGGSRKKVPLGVRVLSFLKAWGKPLTRDQIAKSLKVRSNPSLNEALRRLMSKNLIEALKTENDPVYQAVKRKPHEEGFQQPGVVKRVLDAAASAQGKKKRIA